jgi:hypothetical protein
MLLLHPAAWAGSYAGSASGDDVVSSTALASADELPFAHKLIQQPKRLHSIEAGGRAHLRVCQWLVLGEIQDESAKVCWRHSERCRCVNSACQNVRRATSLTNLLEEPGVPQSTKAAPRVSAIHPEEIADLSVRQDFAAGGVDQRDSIVRPDLPAPFNLHHPCSLLRADRTSDRQGDGDGMTEIIEDRGIEERFGHRV